MQVSPLNVTIGAEVAGIDLADVSDAQVDELWELWRTHKVLFFRDQHITTDQHIAFGRRFGELEIHPFTDDDGQHPEIVRLESTPEEPNSAVGWHSDVTWREAPSLGSILRGVTIPPVGGDTLFADAAAAYDRLSDEWKARIDGLTATHDYMKVFGAGVAPDEQEAMREKFPAVHHPVVRTHPDTGAKSIYTNRYFVSHIDDVEPDESNEIMARLERAITSPTVQCRFRWQPDSFAMWDNRAVQHAVSADFYPQRRVVERVTIVGDKPF